MYRYRIVFLVDTSVAGTLEALSDHFYALHVVVGYVCDARRNSKRHRRHFSDTSMTGLQQVTVSSCGALYLQVLFRVSVD